MVDQLVICTLSGSLASLGPYTHVVLQTSHAFLPVTDSTASSRAFLSMLPACTLALDRMTWARAGGMAGVVELTHGRFLSKLALLFAAARSRPSAGCCSIASLQVQQVPCTCWPGAMRSMQRLHSCCTGCKQW